MQEAVEGTVRECLATEWLETETYREVKESGTIGIQGFEGTSNTFYGTGNVFLSYYAGYYETGSVNIKFLYKIHRIFSS